MTTLVATVPKEALGWKILTPPFLPGQPLGTHCGGFWEAQPCTGSGEESGTPAMELCSPKAFVLPTFLSTEILASSPPMLWRDTRERQEPLLRTQAPGKMRNFNLKFSPGFLSTNFLLFTWFAHPIPIGPRVCYVHYKQDKNNVRLDMRINWCMTIVQDIPVLVHFHHCVLSAAQSRRRGCWEEML